MTYNYPDSTGHFGQFGGIYMAETLIPAVEELCQQYLHFRDDPEFKARMASVTSVDGHSGCTVWPTPVANLRHVLAKPADMALMGDQAVLEQLLRLCGPFGQPGHTFDHRQRQMKSIEPV